MRLFSNVKRLFRAPVRIITFINNKINYGSISWHTTLEKQLRTTNKKNIFLAPYAVVKKYCWLAAEPLTGSEICRLVIGHGCSVGDFAHIYSTKEIILEDNVLLANFVYISDNVHGFEDINMPIIKQPIIQRNTVRIGEGSWLGEHVCVIGANIGKHCVIGANSVVTKDIPDYCVAVGAPAKVIKKFNFNTQQWEKV